MKMAAAVECERSNLCRHEIGPMGGHGPREIASFEQLEVRLEGFRRRGEPEWHAKGPRSAEK